MSTLSKLAIKFETYGSNILSTVMRQRRIFTLSLVQSFGKSSQVYISILSKARMRKTAKRPCGHLGQLHLLEILKCYRHKLKLVIEQMVNKLFKL